jgi:outer membrane protein assembly factor BamB
MKPALLCAFFLLPAAVFGDDWPQYRGPLGTGVGAGAEAPVEWSLQKNVRWRTGIDGAGNSSPIVSKGRVFVTLSSEKGRKRSLLCLDRASGKPLWTRTVEVPGEELTQKDNPYCGSTPCADGQHVVVWHSSGGLHCYDFDGKPLWTRDLGKFVHMWGYGSSPILHGGRVLLNCGPGERTFLVSIEVKTGEIAWKAEEPGSKSDAWVGSWCTPRIVKEQILVAYPDQVKAYEPATGKVAWSVTGLGKLVYADVAIGDGIGVATGEDEGGSSIGFKLGGGLLWSRPRPLEVGTGLIAEGHLWTIDDGGFVRCTQAATGKEVLKDRFPGGAAWSSVVSSGKQFYATTRSGDTVVFVPDPKKFAALAVNKLGEPSNSTPAISDGEIFLRTAKAVYCIAEKK